MAWVKVPLENRPIFQAALPEDPRVETVQMFGGVAAKVNGHVFAGLFGRSTMVWLAEADRAAALALEGAAPFDPMGNRRVRSDKVMLPESVMVRPAELRRWIALAFKAAALLPKKATKVAPARKGSEPASSAKKDVAKPSVAKRPAARRASR
jgi:TfoX/Sxy family transcriptional regulator of competence genes